jgi:alpha-glucuronidase
MLNHWDNLKPLIPSMRTTPGAEYRGGPLFFNNQTIDFNPGQIKEYARILASVGLNRTTISNVNVFDDEKLFITEKYLPRIAEIADILRPFNIRLVLSVFFAMTKKFSDIGNSDPLDERVGAWWKNQTDIVYKHIPDLAGYIVKADSEGEPGPFEYGRTHADGANMLARALKPHGGYMFWRCFVYNSTQDWRDHSIDRPKSCYDIFKPLDGQFDDNVILQIKNGPLDFQPYEPVNPMFGAMKHTRCIMECQVVKEYTGGHTYTAFLPYFWATEVMRFDMGYGEKSTIADMIEDGRLEGVTAVSNLYNVRNWTGHMLDQANIYGYGRLCWNPRLEPQKIADDWTKLTFGDKDVCEIVSKILMDSYPAMGKNNNPFGVSFMCSTITHHGPDIEGYEYSRWGTYHRSNYEGIGVDRTAKGTGFTSQYTPKVEKLLSDPAACPENYLLFIHRLRYDHKMNNGKTLLQNIYNSHFEGHDETVAMAEAWKQLEGRINDEVYRHVAERFITQIQTSREWRDQINTYFRRFTGIDDEKGRKIYD